MYDKLLFVHIPKTSGTSITNFLNSTDSDFWVRDRRLMHHDPLFLLEETNDLTNSFIFAFSRDPYTRSFSYYKHFNRVNNFEYSFKDFLMIVMSRGCIPMLSHILHEEKHLEFLYRTPMIFFTQSYFLFSRKGNTPNKIFQFENIQEFEDQFKISLPHLNKGSYDIDEYQKSLTTETVWLINEIYKDDFNNFSYKKI